MKEDRNKWDRRYARRAAEPSSPDPLLIDRQGLLGSGTALDLAAGTGRNAVYLAERGYTVHAVDVSFAALSPLQDLARARCLTIHCVVADLDYFRLPRDYYDLVVVVNFHDPHLAGCIKASLKRDGLLFYSTFNHRHTSIRPEFNPDYLVAPNGLLDLFSDLEVLLHEPHSGEFGNVSRLIGRKTGRSR